MQSQLHQNWCVSLLHYQSAYKFKVKQLKIGVVMEISQRGPAEPTREQEGFETLGIDHPTASSACNLRTNNVRVEVSANKPDCSNQATVLTPVSQLRDENEKKLLIQNDGIEESPIVHWDKRHFKLLESPMTETQRKHLSIYLSWYLENFVLSKLGVSPPIRTGKFHKLDQKSCDGKWDRSIGTYCSLFNDRSRKLGIGIVLVPNELYNSSGEPNLGNDIISWLQPIFDESIIVIPRGWIKSAWENHHQIRKEDVSNGNTRSESG